MATRGKATLSDDEARLLTRAIRREREFIEPEELAPFLALTGKLKKAFGVEALFPSTGATVALRRRPATVPASRPTLRAELGSSQYGTPEPRLILAWRNRDVPHAEAMMLVHAVAALIWQMRPSGAHWLVNVPFGAGEDRQGRAQATITIETVRGTREEAEAALEVLTEVAARAS